MHSSDAGLATFNLLIAVHEGEGEFRRASAGADLPRHSSVDTRTCACLSIALNLVASHQRWQAKRKHQR
jgi:hypothetical protein